MTQSTDSRVNELWTHFAGMFGAQMLKNKYGVEPPQDWIGGIGSLKDHELQRGMRRLIASGADNIPSLPRFMKLCRAIADDDLDRPAQRELLQLPPLKDGEDGWWINSNMRLMKFILTILGMQVRTSKRDHNPAIFGPVAPYDFKLFRDLQRGGVPNPPNIGSPEQQQSTEILVKWKQQWAQGMREEEAAGDPPTKEYQQETWDACLRQAMAEIKREVFHEVAA